MPRKTRKTSLPNSQKPSLLFFDPPLDDARYLNVPQVRGVLNPKSFLVEEKRQNSCTTCSSWVITHQPLAEVGFLERQLPMLPDIARAQRHALLGLLPQQHTTPLARTMSCPPDFFLRLLLPASQPMTPPHTVTSEILATDTPERDYGVKVTWRRRKGLMRLLRDRGYLSSCYNTS
uniref:Uncharacterized protein n=1 Tax=Oncorhynchus mykiss TaxID=8022 RepID=A0A8C7VL64_ONCMY